MVSADALVLFRAEECLEAITLCSGYGARLLPISLWNFLS